MQPTLGINLRKYLFEQITDDIEYEIQIDIINLFRQWLPFVEVKSMNVTTNNNTLNVAIDFNIVQDPNTLESVNVTIA